MSKEYTAVTGVTTAQVLEPVITFSSFEVGYPKVDASNTGSGDPARTVHIQKMLDLTGEKGKTGWFTVDGENQLACIRRGNSFFFFYFVKLSSPNEQRLKIKLSSGTEMVGIMYSTWTHFGCAESMSESQIMQAVAHRAWSTRNMYYWLNYNGHMIVADRSGGRAPEIYEIAGYARTSDHICPYVVLLWEVSTEYLSPGTGRPPRLVFGASTSGYVNVVKISELTVLSLFDPRYDKV